MAGLNTVNLAGNCLDMALRFAANDPGADMELATECAAVDYARLAARYGTPLFVYDAAALSRTWNQLRAALPPELEIFYSLKANPNVSVVGVLAAEGARAEVCSLLELRTALLAGICATDIIYLGPGKTTAELQACLAAGIYAVVAESFDELGELDRLAGLAGRRQRVMVRVNPTAASSGGGLTMGGKARQFGIDEAQLLRSSDLPARYHWLQLAGVHVYLGTRILDADVLVANTAHNLALAERVAAATGIELQAVDVGGGLGVAYFDGETDPDLGSLPTALGAVVADFRSRHPDARLLLETGRYLTAGAGVYLIRVQSVKESVGKRFAVADGGTNHHMSAGGIGSYVKRNFPFSLLSRASTEPPQTWQVTGPLCTPNDTVLKNAELPPLRAGDLLGIGRSGAYGPTASPGLFLGHGFAAEVLLSDGQTCLIRHRDTTTHLLRQQRYHHLGSQPMQRQQVIEHIRLAISRTLQCEVPELTEQSPLAELGLDSTGMLEMLMELEDSSSFQVDADDLDPHVFSTVGSLADYVARMVAVP
jgi:diaminopimelate decarboxylase